MWPRRPRPRRTRPRKRRTKTSSPAPGEDAGELTVATIGKPHGLDGEVLVRTQTADGDEIFAAGRVFRLRGGGVSPGGGDRLTLESSRPHRGGYLLTFREVSDRDTAAGLRGAELTVPRSDLRPLAEGEFFAHEFVGMELYDEAAGRLGEIVDVYEASGQWLVGVEVEGRERLVPLRAETVRRVHVNDRRIDVALPEGLLEI